MTSALVGCQVELLVFGRKEGSVYRGACLAGRANQAITVTWMENLGRIDEYLEREQSQDDTVLVVLDFDLVKHITGKLVPLLGRFRAILFAQARGAEERFSGLHRQFRGPVCLEYRSKKIRGRSSVEGISSNILNLVESINPALT